MIYNIIIVAFGGAIGSVLRFLIGLSIPPLWVINGTMIVNFIGSFIMGAIFAFLVKYVPEAAQVKYKLFFMVGVLGGFTTFSSFSLDSLLLFEQEAYFKMAVYIILSLVLSLGGVIAGASLVKMI